ncbi:MAG: glycosyltransferase family 9 protein [Bacteroidetes bacterium]|nr:glycosyltransferase family 9 protein [Bacteroidota bacterium]
MSKQKRILIVRPDRIGDVVLSTPLPREIKKTFPDSFVAVLVRKYTQDIYSNNPYVDKILLIDDYDDGSLKSFFRKAREIRGYGFTHSLILLPTERLNYLMFFSGIPYRVGVSHKFYQFITFTHYVSRRKYIPLRHEADYCMDLARKIGVQTDNLDTEIFLTNEEKEKVAQVRSELLGGKKYLIGVHASSGNSAPNWEADEYKRLLKSLIANDDFSVVVTDNKIPPQLEGLSNVSYPNVGKPLRESFVNFAALDLLVSSSTGTMHIAAALKVKTLSMFCPLTACSPKLWGPLGNKNKIVLPTENYCQTVCPGDPKKCSFAGEGGIDSNRILEELKLFLY